MTQERRRVCEHGNSVSNDTVLPLDLLLHSAFCKHTRSALGPDDKNMVARGSVTVTDQWPAQRDELRLRTHDVQAQHLHPWTG